MKLSTEAGRHLTTKSDKLSVVFEKAQAQLKEQQRRMGRVGEVHTPRSEMVEATVPIEIKNKDGKVVKGFINPKNPETADEIQLTAGLDLLPEDKIPTK